MVLPASTVRQFSGAQEIFCTVLPPLSLPTYVLTAALTPTKLRYIHIVLQGTGAPPNHEG